ncbi:MAG: type II toxin-antitoxin system VapB family antitoxin [Alphaproteobacteria bacterium]|nr:type II toxin-antitoxin system VapB family antitoxin [Alphaproteobacteria bacterium]
MQLRAAMRIEIDIDDALMAEVMEAGGFKTEEAAVEAPLRLLARTLLQGRLRALYGKLDWQGSLDDMRRDR